MRKAGARASAKIHQLVQDLHEKLAKFLCTNFSVILFPKFESSKMIHRSQRKSKAETARALATWSHFRATLVIEIERISLVPSNYSE